MSIDRAFLTDETRSVEDRVTHLLAQMTLAEKIAQLGSCWIYEVLDGLNFSPTKASKLLKPIHPERFHISHLFRLALAITFHCKENSQIKKTGPPAHRLRW